MLKLQLDHKGHLFSGILVGAALMMLIIMISSCGVQQSSDKIAETLPSETEGTQGQNPSSSQSANNDAFVLLLMQ